MHGAGRALLEAQERFAGAAAQVAQGPEVEGPEVEGVVAMRLAETQVKASVEAVRAVDESLGTLIDLFG